MTEEWRDIPEYEGLYQVSNQGRVRSLPRVVIRSNGTPLSVSGRTLKAAPNSGGYLCVGLSKADKQWVPRVHILVAQTFIGQRPAGYDINHKNGDKTDNRAENLEYVTRAQNVQHAYDNGLIIPDRGEANGNSKLTAEQVIEIRGRYAEGGISQETLGKEYGINQTQVGFIVRREVWTHI